MRQGAVALFDALGFKGIWSREDPEKVISKLHAFQGAVDEELDDVHSRTNRLGKELGIETKVTVALLSDTVVIGASGTIVDHHDRREQADCDSLALLALARVTGKVLVRAAQSPPALAYRGCMAVGRFEMAGNFIIGPAVDEAAEAMDSASAAAVWLTPSAVRAWTAQGFHKDEVFGAVLSPCVVPMKGGERYETFAANDCASIDDPLERMKHVERVIGTFKGNRMDIEIKRQNTVRLYVQLNARLAPRPLGPEKPPEQGALGDEQS